MLKQLIADRMSSWGVLFVNWENDSNTLKAKGVTDMKNPLISVIVPVYRVENYLPECIESICSQTYTNLEIILVDDGSPDNCGAICEKYAAKDSRIKVVHKPNGGLSSARNAGLDVASGEFIGFVDSDDIIEHEMYEKMMHTLLEKEADLCFCRVVAMDEDGTRRENNRLYGIGEVVLNGMETMERLLKQGSTYFESAWNKLYNRELFENLRFAEGKLHEDARIIHRIYGKCNRVVVVEDLFYIYRLRSGSIMRGQFTVKRLDLIEAYMDRVNYCLSENMQELAGHAMVQLVGKMLEIWMTMEKGNYAAKKRIREQRREAKQLCKRVSLERLSVKERMKVYLALYATFIYRIKLKMKR